MARTDRTTAADLSGHLRQSAARFSFFQAVELIQRQLDESRDPGTQERAADEKLVFDVAHSLSFPLSDVVDIRPLAASPGARGQAAGIAMTVAFLGLHGSGSPLPSYYGERIARCDSGGSVVRDFLDFFHNRIVGLLYRAWRKHRYHRLYRPGAGDRFSQRVYALFGLGDGALRTSSAIHWPRLLCLAGPLSARSRSPAVMAAVIGRAFGLASVRIEEWMPRKVDTPADQRTRLGRANAALGASCVLGSYVEDIQGKFRIVIDQLDFSRFQEFLPHGPSFAALRGLAGFMLRDQLACDLRLGLRRGEAVPLTLERTSPCRLGWSSFLELPGSQESRNVVIRVRS